ncbi:MAG: FHA domain-containing protein [Deltaproteobacteria bacterium]|nr:FHA domain-containing protein [Deltaproteobacteria bacterium]MBW2531926.1 FHA domain-containing protein [Deltaproteobacteria bacterium]
MRRHIALTRVRELAQSLSLAEFQRHIGPFGLLRHRLEDLEALPGGDGNKTTEIDPQEIVGKLMLLALESGNEQVVTLTRAEPGAQIVVGRAPGRDLTIDHHSVSKMHAVLQWNEPPMGCVLRDLGSTNGTFVNALQLGSDPVSVKDGDVISFGDVAYSYQLAESIYRRLGGQGLAQTPSQRPPASGGAPIGAVKLRRSPASDDGRGD